MIQSLHAIHAKIGNYDKSEIVRGESSCDIEIIILQVACTYIYKSTFELIKDFRE